ncbi:SusF/SusE family outer membrane protein [Echinicola jeungdonensis]|uniref:SusF/SusE family outer membrane protein n=1 Tax=Echinicola jeungdonensis TaxID=709343 RepID=A0ABV5J3V8_9BACT|nr:SusF/SusE family outer membrane protein [Echinicola jeungdonensis]MDN3670670.1 SusF/SusE family outer membrane protein [Echinicola jeungdonensis]
MKIFTNNKLISTVNWTLTYLGIMMVALFSCQEEEVISPSINRTAEFSASTTSLQLKQKNSSQNALTFSWTAGSNRGTNARINYALQLVREGGDFQNGLTLNFGSQVYQSEFKVGEFNTMVKNEFGLEAGKTHGLEARLVTIVKDDSIDPVYSEAIQLEVIPFDPVTSTLYIIGDASPNGWDANQATPLIPDAQDPTKFRGQVALTPGNFKFITDLGEFLPSYNKGEGEFSLFYRDSDEEPDEQFNVSEAGMYLVTVNLSELILTLEKQEGPAFENLYIVGDASESGWNIDSPTAFKQSEDDPFVFTYEGMLTEGQFKILAGATGDWCGEWYRPTTDGQDISNNEIIQLSGCDPDYKWKVDAEQVGYYKITLDQRNLTIDISTVNLYIIGDAGPNGWDIQGPMPMEKDGAVFTYSGPLTAGEFKIAKFKGDWCDGEWINAATSGQPIGNTDFIFTQACEGPDNKWKVSESEAGDYTIQIDLSLETISITGN